jgi:hypothetical protein
VSPRFTRRGALGGAAALALASCGGGDPAPTGGARAGSGAATLSSIVALEHAAVAAWATIGDQLHGDAPPSARAASSYAPSFPRLTSAADALHFARDLQERLVRAYFEGLVVLHDAGQRRAVAEIGAAQAEDLAVVHLLAGDPAAPQAFVTGTS